LKSVLHDWDDEKCALILAQCRRALALGGRHDARLLVIERIAPATFGTSPQHRAIARSDLNMLVSLGGRERTLQEYQSLIERTGLRIVRSGALASEYSVIEVTLSATRTPTL
jgi:orsellinic acid C2-O-methyltransferase